MQGLAKSSHSQIELIRKYGNDEKTFIDVCNGVMKMVVLRGSEECFFGCYPTMAQVNAAYHKNMSKAILMAQLTDLSEYCGCKNKLDNRQMEQCAEIIGMTYPYLKISELALFFMWLKSARYGRFYGAIDPMIIVSALHDFVRERNQAYFDRDKIIQKRKFAEAKETAISWEEYCRKNGIASKKNPIKI